MPTQRSLRVALSIALILATASLFSVKSYMLIQSAGRRVGFVHDYWSRPEGILVTEVAPGLPAYRAGLRPGDMILAVDGASLANPAYDSYAKMARRFQPGKSAEFRVLRSGSISRMRISPGVSVDWTLLLSFAFSVSCFLAVALLTLRPALDGDLRARLLLGYTTVTILDLASPDSAIGVIGWPRLEIFSFILHWFLAYLELGIFLHIASLVPRRPVWLERRPWLVPLSYSVCLGLAISLSADLIDRQLSRTNLIPWSVAQLQAFAGVVVVIGALVGLFLLAIQAIRHPEPKGRNQARLILAFPVLLFLCAAALLVAARFGLVLPGMWRDALFSLLCLSYAASCSVAIFRYDLFDIEQVVRRGMVYSVLTAGLIAIFYAVQGVGGVLLSRVLGGKREVWAVAFATLLLGLLFVPLRRFLQRAIDERFFPERHAVRHRLLTLAGELPFLGHLPRMGEQLILNIRDLFLARSVVLLLADPESRVFRRLAATGSPEGVARTQLEEELFLLPLEDPAIGHLGLSRRPLRIENLTSRSPILARRLKSFDPASLMIPLLHQKKLVGLLIVGPKAVGNYPAEELDLLQFLSQHVAVVFENARLFESATYEGLTGLLRREAVLEQLEGELERARRYRRPLSVAIADLDHFKKINDCHGHLAGDTLLRHISQVIAAGLRSTDQAGRYGGEEFLLVLPETDLQHAGVLAEKIRDLVERAATPMEDGAVVQATVSIGVASLDDIAKEGSGSARDLIAAADRSLYCAKELGRNRVHPEASNFEELVCSA